VLANVLMGSTWGTMLAVGSALGALIADGGLAALECEASQQVAR